MERFRRLFLLSIVLLGLLLSTTVGLVGCGEEKTDTKADETTATATGSSTLLADRVIEVLASTEMTGDYAANAIAADKLAAKLADPVEKETVFLLDIRSKEDFDKGHIEGAVQMDYLKWASADNMMMLPSDKKIIVICYSGNTAAQAVAGMRILGHDAAALKGGMAGWEAGKGAGAITDLQAAGNAIVNDAATTEAAEAPSSATYTPLSAEGHEALMGPVNEYFSTMQGGGINVITAADLKAKLDGAEKDSVTLLDIRSAEDFTTVGHIAGALNVPFKAVAVPDNLSMLVKDKQVVVICYTGNTAAQAVTALNLLGYDAVSLKYGMMGWTQTPNTASFIEYLNAAAYPVVQ